MPKRKSGSGEPASFPTPTLTSLDAALDLLACETFSRLSSLTAKFETAVGVKLNDGVIKNRWDEACMRYWLMKSMDDLSCATSSGLNSSTSNGRSNGDGREMEMAEDDAGNRQETDSHQSSGPKSSHPGAIVAFGLDEDETLGWRRWTPKLGDLVLVELPGGTGVWPGKVIDKKVCFQGRSIPRGNHFYAVRVYSHDLEPAVTIKSRMIPLSLRPSPPIMASTSLLSAYNHVSNPTTFDMVASHRESAAAHSRTHPGAGNDEVMAQAKSEKDQWLKFTHWLMDERRVEKLRALVEERDRRLKAVTQADGFEDTADNEESKPRKRRVTSSLMPFAYLSTKHRVHKVEGNPNERGGIFKVSPIPLSPSTTASTPPTRSASDWGSPVGSRGPMSSYIRPALSAPYRSSSPRRAERRRNGMLTGIGDFSPRPRGGTYTPPRVLPSGDETAPFGSPSPAPSLKRFDFVSPLGPVKMGTLTTDMDDDTIMLPKNGLGSNLEVVLEDTEEEGNWSLVASRRHKRAGSAPVEKAEKSVVQPNASDDLVLV